MKEYFIHLNHGLPKNDEIQSWNSFEISSQDNYGLFSERADCLSEVQKNKLLDILGLC